MKNGLLLSLLFITLLLTACTQTDSSKQTIADEETPTEQQPSNVLTQNSENNLNYELLMQLDFMPHEVGTTISLIQDEHLYNLWAELFQFKTIPVIDFTKEDVLFITTYTDGCGRVLGSITKDHQQLVAQLQYPENLRNKKEIVCTEIAIPVTFVVKLEKSGLIHGTLKDMNRILLENVLLIQ